MMQENEIVTLLLGIGGMIFLMANLQRLRPLPSWKIFITSYCVLLLGWIMTVIEGFLMKDLFNFLEHACYSVSAAMLAFWCWLLYRKKTVRQ